MAVRIWADYRMLEQIWQTRSSHSALLSPSCVTRVTCYSIPTAHTHTET